MLDKEIILGFEKKIIVNNDPFPYATIENFLPVEIVKKAEEEFINLKKTKADTKFFSPTDSGNMQFQKTKRYLESYKDMPTTLKKIIDFFYSTDFMNLLERKFNLKNVQADWSLYGGGLHESFKGGFLKVHSDFIYKRKSKLKRVLNLLLYLNSNWQKNWGGAIELWDKDMKLAKKSILPTINTALVFRTDNGSNHGYPEPINCPENVRRKSIALYYYVKEKTFLPISIRRRKLYYAVWKKRPDIDEPKFGDKVGDNVGFFKRLKHRFFYRFF